MRSDTPALISSVLLFLQPCTAAPALHHDQIVLGSHGTNASDIRAALKNSSIIPDGTHPQPPSPRPNTLPRPPTDDSSIVLDDFTPSLSLHLSYPSSHSDVLLGNSLSPSAVQASPFFSLSPLALSIIPSHTLKPNTTYTLALTDPDATSRSDPKMAQMCHWIVTNITLSSSAAEGEEYVLTPMFDELMSYVPPSPPPKTGYHRYVFALLAPSSSITTAAIDTSSTTITANGLDLKKPKDRPHWGYGKVGKGVRDWAEENKLTVVGANFFYAENEKQ